MAGLGRATMECRLCHRIGSRDFTESGSEVWECRNDVACRRRRQDRVTRNAAGQTITLLMGLPGSGKSTLARALRAPDVRVVGRDQIRTEIFGENYTRSPPEPARELVVTRRQVDDVEEALASGRDVIIDDTNVTAAARRLWSALAAQLGARVQLEYVDAALDECLARNSGRDRQVPEGVIRQMHREHVELGTGLLTRVADDGPVRVQLSRRPGWRIPTGAVSVARPGRWGNPYAVVNAPGSGWAVAGPHGIWSDRWPLKFDAQVAAVLAFRRMVDDPQTGWASAAQEQVAGRSLACWCRIGDPCHADVLLEAANDQVIPLARERAVGSRPAIGRV